MRSLSSSSSSESENEEAPLTAQVARLPKPLQAADLSRVQAVFTDVDGTLTSSDRLESGTVRAIELLVEAGVRVVLVSGRPAGWGECWARQLPVEGVIVENGGLYFARERSGHGVGANGELKLRKVYAQSQEVRERSRTKLVREVQKAMNKVEGARLSSDSQYTEVDIAIDYNEEVRLGSAAATALENLLRKRGVQAVRSSVHVNCWIGSFDKLSMVRRFIRREWGLRLQSHDKRFVYVGDSFNDAPMFEAFPLSVGVANVRDVLVKIDHAPAYITRAREGSGFRELVRAVLAQRESRQRLLWRPGRR